MIPTPLPHMAKQPGRRVRRACWHLRSSSSTAYPHSNPNHERRRPESRHIARRDAMCVYNPLLRQYLTECDAVARKIPFEDPDVLFYVRVGYVLSQVIVLGAYYYVSLAVRTRVLSPAPISCFFSRRSKRRTIRPYSNTVSHARLFCASGPGN